MKTESASRIDRPVHGMKVAVAAGGGASVSGTELEAGLAEFERVAGQIVVEEVAGYEAAVLVAFVAQSPKALQASPTAGLHMRTLTTQIIVKSS